MAKNPCTGIDQMNENMYNNPNREQANELSNQLKDV